MLTSRQKRVLWNERSNFVNWTAVLTSRRKYVRWNERPERMGDQ